MEPIEEEEPSHDKLRMWVVGDCVGWLLSALRDNLFTKLTSYLVDELHTNRLREERIPKVMIGCTSSYLPSSSIGLVPSE